MTSCAYQESKIGQFIKALMTQMLVVKANVPIASIFSRPLTLDTPHHFCIPVDDEALLMLCFHGFSRVVKHNKFALILIVKVQDN